MRGEAALTVTHGCVGLGGGRERRQEMRRDTERDKERHTEQAVLKGRQVEQGAAVCEVEGQP